MRNNRNNSGTDEQGDGILLIFTGLIIAVLVKLILCSCSTTRRTVRTDTRMETVTADTVIEETRADSVDLSESSDYRSMDATLSLSLESGKVVFNRDSSGRVASCIWNISTSGLSRSEMQEKSDLRIKAVAATESGVGKRSVTGKSTAVSKTSEKKSGASVECRIGWTLTAFAILYVIYVIVKDHILPWIKRRKAL